MPRWRQADPVLKHAVTRHSRCGGKRHRLGVVGVCTQRRRHAGVCEQNRRSDPTGAYHRASTMRPQELAAVPHFFQLRPFVRPASLALHVHVDLHGFLPRSGEKPAKNDRNLGSDSEVVLVTSIRQLCANLLFGVSACLPNFVIQASRLRRRQWVRKANYRMSTAPLFPTS